MTKALLAGGRQNADTLRVAKVCATHSCLVWDGTAAWRHLEYLDGKHVFIAAAIPIGEPCSASVLLLRGLVV